MPNVHCTLVPVSIQEQQGISQKQNITMQAPFVLCNCVHATTSRIATTNEHRSR